MPVMRKPGVDIIGIVRTLKCAGALAKRLGMERGMAVRGMVLVVGVVVAGGVIGVASCSPLRHCKDGCIPPSYCHEPTTLCVLPDKVDGGDDGGDSFDGDGGVDTADGGDRSDGGDGGESSDGGEWGDGGVGDGGIDGGIEVPCTATSCPVGSWCSGSRCVAQEVDGAPCDGGQGCLSAACVSGLCCDDACSGGCGRCDLPASRGKCTPADPGDPGIRPSCAPYLCDGVHRECPTSCSGAGSCVATATCIDDTCTGRKGNGQACSQPDQCVSGKCADGVCCNSDCAGACDACNLPSSLGTCAPLGSGAAGTPSCAPYVCNGALQSCPVSCSGDSNCVAGNYCAGTSCAPKRDNGQTCSAPTQCKSGNCINGTCCGGTCGPCGSCSSGSCTALGAGAAGNPSCAPYVCGSGVSCPTGCTGDAQCIAGDYCNGTGCVPKKSNGQVCSGPSQCASGYCVDQVCCDSACNDKACQRCDAASSNGTGRCGWVASQSDPDRECTGSSWACASQCTTVTTTYTCSGSGYACGAHQAGGNVPSGSLCASNSIVPVSSVNYCNAGNSCADGLCSAEQWWTSCNGAGSCRAASDKTNALVVPVYASFGYSLNGSCGTAGVSLCSAVNHCSGQTQYAGYSCDSAHSCTVSTQKIGCCGCGDYSCNFTSYVCNTGCSTDQDCAFGSYCVTTVGGYANTCQSGGLGAPCDVPLSPSLPLGADCDPTLTCTSAKICKLIENQGCTSDDQCGQNFGPSGQTALHDLHCRAAGTQLYGPLVCNGGAAYCCD